MTTYIKFPSSLDKPSRWGEQEVPSHTQQSLEDYLIHGYPPGGFVTSVLTNNLYGAVARADHVNKRNVMAIADWVMNYAPEQSWGSDEAVADWLDDKDGRRTRYSDRIMKAHTWDSLKGSNAGYY